MTGGEMINGVPHLASIGSGNFNQVLPSLRKISEIFGPFGSVQMLGCDVGGGAKT